MHISPGRFDEFKKIMKEHVGEEKFSTMSEQYLFESAIKLVTMLKIIYKPMTQEEFELFSKPPKEGGAADEK